MPDFRLTEAEAAALALDLAGARPGSGGGDADRFQKVVRQHPDADAAAGARVRAALRCDGCHGDPSATSAAPPLAGVADHLDRAWLMAFLRQPRAVRPFGWLPGTGTRMPDFRLSQAEADSLVSWLEDRVTNRWTDTARPESLSTTQARRTETLIRERWGCLGCHALRGEGGRIGPDLAAAATRLRPGYLRAIIEDPASAAPASMMPRSLLQPRDIDRIVAFLGHMEDTLAAGVDLSVLDHQPIRIAGSGATLYESHCAACHGQDGGGDGFNARYLRTEPAIHADSATMSQRPDDTLYDGIHAGARILAGSAEMPAFGASLSPDEIRALVRHIRVLCRCAGPSWSRDGGTQ
jgi:mono/diheme cytochrome c family protein